MPHCTAYRILVPQPEMEPGPPHWKRQVLTTGSPGDSLHYFSQVVKNNVLNLWSEVHAQHIVGGQVPFRIKFLTPLTLNILYRSINEIFLFFKSRIIEPRTPLVAQWLKLHASIPGWGTKIPQVMLGSQKEKMKPLYLHYSKWRKGKKFSLFGQRSGCHILISTVKYTSVQ